MKAKSLYTKKLGSALANSASKRPVNGRLHIITSQTNRWSVVMEGDVRPIRVFATKGKALSYASKTKSLAKAKKVVIHGQNGEILKSISI